MSADAPELWLFDLAPPATAAADPLGRLLADLGLAAEVAPEVQARVNGRIADALARGAPRLAAEFPARLDGALRWLALHARAEPTRLRGVLLDITARRQSAERSEAVQRELTHRVKNIMAVVSGLISLAARSTPEAQVFAAAMRKRIVALAGIYRHVEPESDATDGNGTSPLGAFLAEIAAPYADAVRLDLGAGSAAIPVGRRAATALALLVHELATNATKHGALASARGTVLLSARLDGARLELCWAEQDGPALGGPPGLPGFGMTMSDRIAATMLGSQVVRQWHEAGLVASLSVRLDLLAA
ncbi:sensor histidine kinase [Roseomonas sp. AR75]|uniref:sensor histidine kinase n=1 Tax=Roseomonas sp. AR75 TaxID=2562311 RepID=UPI0014858EF2|nr:sensor histidine kinase [Roseomonas sp. AR75]